MATPAEAAALAAVGLRPAAPVLGLSVLAMPPLLDATPMVSAPVTWRARPNAYVKGRELALERVRGAAHRVGAIGVVGITFRERPIVGDDEGHTTSGGWMPVEFTAVATPVLGAVVTHPRRLMCAALSGVDVAALLLAGWCPADVLVAATVEQWDRSRFLVSDALADSSRYNREITGVSELVQRARSVVRRRLHDRAKVLGADGVLLPGAIETRATSTHMFVEATATGTAIVRLRGRPDAPSPAMVVECDDRRPSDR
jgi:uncharacterized protein YbjQ (UPF0145 family)